MTARAILILMPLLLLAACGEALEPVKRADREREQRREVNDLDRRVTCLEKRDPGCRCDTPARYEAMADGADCQ